MSEAAVPSSATASGPVRWALLAGVWLVYACFGLMVAAMAPMVGPIAADLGVGPAAMGAILGAWPLTYIVAAIPCGMLLDRLGERLVLLVAAGIMAASGLARALAEGPEAMFLAVALFGIGGPMISVGAPRLIAGWFTGPSRATAMGIYITGPSVGGILALALTNSVALPLMGGDWRGVLALYGGIVAASGLVWLAIASLPAARARGGDASAGKKVDPRAFAEILRLREVQLVLAMAVGIFFVNHALNNWLPELLQTRGLDPVAAGYWAALPTLVGIAGSLVIPRLAVPARRLRVMTLLFCAALAASLLLHLAPGPLLAAGLVLQGIARSSMMTIAILLLMETRGVPPARLGLAGGMFFTTAEIGGVLGPVSFGALVQATGGFDVPLMALTAVCLGLLALIAALARAQAR